MADSLPAIDMESKPKDYGDLLESSVLLEENHYQEGFKDGYNDGLVSGKEEGREVGLKTGFEVAEELGFYSGCVDVWSSLIQVDSDVFSSRLQRNIQQLRDLIMKYPLMDPENEHVQELMDEMRLKFKIITANMRVKLEYEGYLKNSKHEERDL